MPARVGPQRRRPGTIAYRQLSQRSAPGRRDEFFGFADSDVSYGSDHMFISIIPMGCWDSSGAGWHPYPFVAVASFHQWDCSVGPRMRQMIAR